MIKIAASILSANFASMGAAAADAERWGADILHCDIMDGSYVPHITFGHEMVAALKAHTALPLDVHLMVEHPETQISLFAEAGAHTITFHPDASTHAHRTLQSIKAAGVKAGIALNPGQGVKHYGFLIDSCDLVLVMAVNPGFGGQRFIPSAQRKIEELCAFREKLGVSFDIAVDGGINAETAKIVAAAGANVLISGSTIFSSPDPAATVLALRAEP